MNSLTNRTALVTGAAQGLGYAIADAMLREGASVVLADIGSQLAKTSTGLADQHPDGQVTYAEGDLTDPVNAEAAVNAALRATGRVDVLINAAGSSGMQRAQDIEEVHVDLWDRIVANNLKTTFLCCRAAVPHMKQAGFGRIVNFSSVAASGVHGDLGTVGARLPYAAAKAGVEAFTRQLAKDLGGTGITVNAICPGFIVPEGDGRIVKMLQGLGEDARSALIAAIPL